MSKRQFQDVALSDHANLLELRYRDEIQPLTDSPQVILKKIRESGRLALVDYLRNDLGLEFRGRILEIGAGSGWLSATLSTFAEVDEVISTDFSRRLVDEVMPFVAESLGAEDSKLQCRIEDFHRLTFPNDSFDWVIADSALHHASEVVTVLKEVARVLKPSATFVAVREPVRPIIPWFAERCRQEAETELLAQGVREPFYRLREWQGFFQAAGFKPRFEAVSFSHGIRRLASLALNGLIKADYCMIATKPGASSHPDGPLR